MEFNSIKKHEELTKQINLLLSPETTCNNEKMIFELLEKSLTVFHAYDENFLKILILAFEKYQLTKNHQKCLQIAKLILMNYHENRSKFDSKTVDMEITLSMLCYNLKIFNEAYKHIINAKDILTIGYGEDHPKVTQECRKILQNIEIVKRKQMSST